MVNQYILFIFFFLGGVPNLLCDFWLWHVASNTLFRLKVRWVIIVRQNWSMQNSCDKKLFMCGCRLIVVRRAWQQNLKIGSTWMSFAQTHYTSGDRGHEMCTSKRHASGVYSSYLCYIYIYIFLPCLRTNYCRFRELTFLFFFSFFLPTRILIYAVKS